MAHALTTTVATARLDASSAVPEDPLDMQGLWPITTDLTSTLKQVASGILPLARSLFQSDSPAAPAMRQRLLELRARFVYMIEHMGVHIVGLSSQLMTTMSHSIAANLRQDPSADRPGDLAHLLVSVLGGCATSRLLANDCLAEWQSLYPALSRFQESQRSPNGVSSFLRTIGALSTAPTSSPSSLPSANQAPGADVTANICRMLRSLDRIEVFWRKREQLFTGTGYTFTHDQLLRFHKACQRLGDSYLTFSDSLGFSQVDLSNVPPCITKSTNITADTSRIQVAWRDLLPESTG